MKCSKCQSEMIQAKGSWLCMECGHLESISASSVPIVEGVHISESLTPHVEPEPIVKVEARKLEEVVLNKTVEETPHAEVQIEEAAPAMPKREVIHTIDHLAQANTAPKAEPPIPFPTPNPAAVVEAYAPTPPPVTPIKKAKRKHNSRKEATQQVKAVVASPNPVVEAPIRVAAPSASELHPMTQIPATRSEAIKANEPKVEAPDPIAVVAATEPAAQVEAAVQTPAPVVVTDETKIEERSVDAAAPVMAAEIPDESPLQQVVSEIPTGVESTPSVPALDSALPKAIAQDTPAPSPEINTVTPVTHPKPMSKKLIISIVTLVLGLVALAGLIYAYVQGIDIISVILQK